MARRDPRRWGMNQRELYSATWHRHYRARYDEELFSRPDLTHTAIVARARRYADRMAWWSTPRATVMQQGTAALHLMLIFATCGLWAVITVVCLVGGLLWWLTGVGRRP